MHAVFCVTQNNFNVCFQQIPGLNNIITADALSCFQQDRLRKLAPKANLHTDNIPVWPQQAFTAASCSAGVAQSIWHTYQLSLSAYFLFCSRFNITTAPASSLTLC